MFKLPVSFVLAFLSLASICPASGQQKNESIRVATYNAFLLSPVFNCFNPNFADCLIQTHGRSVRWATHLADTILADTSRFDIIAINEAWDEDARAILVKRLRKAYPNIIRKIDADLIQARGSLLQTVLKKQPIDIVQGMFGNIDAGKINGEDSGLMLFANDKFEFVSLPSNLFKWGRHPDESLDATTSNVAFKLYQACEPPDCFAAKGAALVRLRHKTANRVYDVVFTHTQAGYPPEQGLYTAKRDSQFEDIRKLIETTLGTPLPIQDRILVMGDLNINVPSATAEWKQRFDTPGTFFTSPLYDAWARTSSTIDPGITNSNDHERLDYILSFPEPYIKDHLEVQPVCVQHMTTPLDFRDLESDHYMLIADLNVGFAFCHPRIAYEVNLPAARDSRHQPMESIYIDRENGTDVTQIVRPGAMQWFHVSRKDAGTYDIGHNNPAIRIDIYAAQDLTTPVSRYNKITKRVTIGERHLLADTYVLPSEFYIRVSGKLRSTTGNYSLWIKRRTCVSKDEACILQPGQVQWATLTKRNNPLGTQNQAWFQFDVTSDSAARADQDVTLTADKVPVGDTNFKVSLQYFSNTNGLPAPVARQDGARWVFDSLMGNGSAGYLLIEQFTPSDVDLPVTALMDTTMRYLTLFDLTCYDETNPEIGSDDIYAFLTLDGATTRVPNRGEVEFDCDEPQDQKPWARDFGPSSLSYVQSGGIRLFERDSTSPDDAAHFRPFPAVSPEITSLDGTESDRLEWDFDGGNYNLTFQIQKRLNEPVR